MPLKEAHVSRRQERWVARLLAHAEAFRLGLLGRDLLQLQRGLEGEGAPLGLPLGRVSQGVRRREIERSRIPTTYNIHKLHN